MATVRKFAGSEADGWMLAALGLAGIDAEGVRRVVVDAQAGKNLEMYVEYEGDQVIEISVMDHIAHVARMIDGE